MENIIDVKEFNEVEEIQDKPTLELGNYLITIKSNGQVIKKLAVSNSEIDITKLADGGMTVEL